MDTSIREIKSLKLGDTAPDFVQDSTIGKIHFHEWAGRSWILFFSHPKDFTPVCTTELGAVAKLKPEFMKRNLKAIGLSVDSASSHMKWIRDIEETQGCRLNFPLIADENRMVSELYGMIHPNASQTSTVRSVFVIDPEKKIRLTIDYPDNTGRNFAEILRVIDSLQLADRSKVATPANWKPGEDVIISPSVKGEEELSRRFPRGFKTLKSYLRMTPHPK